jgi:glycyl-tRNA synthetase beta chain
MVPTGSRDPYGLRRSVQGACRIIIDAQVPQSLAQFIDWALEGFRGSPIPEAAPQTQVRDTLLEFYRGRLQYLAEEASLRQDTVRAALAAGFDDPYDARQRMQALDAMRREADFESLATAHKRIKKILQGQPLHSLQASLLQEEAEVNLHRAAEASRATVETATAGRDYLAALRAIAQLRPHLDRFFDEVMVMAEDRSLRQNRLALLQDIAGLFMKVGDFSEIVVAGEPAVAATHYSCPRN